MRRLRQTCSRLFALIALPMIMAFASASQAGTLRVAETYSEYCQLEFIGAIERGDGAQFEEIQSEAWPNLAICLDSENGDFAEAIRIVRDFGFTTMIPPGARCAGACGILFMGGRYVTGNGVPAEYRSRMLWPGGRLVFYGPSQQAGEDGFARAMELAADLYELNQRRVALGEQEVKIIPDALLRVLLETTPDNPHPVETAGDLIMFDLTGSLPRIKLEGRFSEQELRNACQSYLTEHHATPHGWGYFNRIPDRDIAETREKAFEWSEDRGPFLGHIARYETASGGSGVFGMLSGFALQNVGSGNSNYRQRMCLAHYQTDDRKEIQHGARIAIVDVFALEAAIAASGADVNFSPQNEEAVRLLAQTIADAFEDAANSGEVHTNRFLEAIDFTYVPKVYLRDFNEKIETWQDAVHYEKTMQNFVTDENQIERLRKKFQ